MTRLAIFGAVLLLAALAIWHPAPRAVPIVADRAAPHRSAARSHLTTPGTEAVVYVVGAIVRPGLYHLPAGSRVDDAVRLAGGLGAGADPAGVNLAEHITDGEEIAVPKVGDPSVRSRRPTRSAKHRARRSSSPTPSLDPVDLNAADVATLEELPGVGPALAQRIVAYRNVNGPFVSLDELADVAGMTDRRLEQVAPFLIVH